MSTQVSSVGSKIKLVVVLVVLVAAGYYTGFFEGLEGSQFEDSDDEFRSVILFVRWSEPLDREVEVSYWVDGEPQPVGGESRPGHWQEWFNATIGTRVHLVAEDVSEGGRLSCYIYEGKQGKEILMREHSEVNRGPGVCDIEHRVGDPPRV